MSKQRQKQRSKARKGQTAPAKAGVQTRRDTLRWVRNGGIAAAILAGGGYWTVRSVEAHNIEHDLSRIGTGTPMVVQIHDPNCPVCNALKREALAALRHFDDDQLQYVVANIRTTEGRSYAARHQVQHVTLLLVDEDGQVRDIITGSQESDTLRAAFEAHLQALGTS